MKMIIVFSILSFRVNMAVLTLGFCASPIRLAISKRIDLQRSNEKILMGERAL